MEKVTKTWIVEWQNIINIAEAEIKAIDYIFLLLFQKSIKEVYLI